MEDIRVMCIYLKRNKKKVMVVGVIRTVMSSIFNKNERGDVIRSKTKRKNEDAFGRNDEAEEER